MLDSTSNARTLELGASICKNYGIDQVYTCMGHARINTPTCTCICSLLIYQLPDSVLVYSNSACKSYLLHGLIDLEGSVSICCAIVTGVKPGVVEQEGLGGVASPSCTR